MDVGGTGVPARVDQGAETADLKPGGVEDHDADLHDPVGGGVEAGGLHVDHGEAGPASEGEVHMAPP